MLVTERLASILPTLPESVNVSPPTHPADLLACAPMDKRTFLAELGQLQRARNGRGTPDCFNSEGCDNCSHCMFCSDCRNCHRCNYAERSVGCTHCTKLSDCEDCHQSSQLAECVRCVDSHYLVKCVDCAECTYCFGCVGLVRKEFHILNEPYDRKTYFQIVKALQRDFGL